MTTNDILPAWLANPEPTPRAEFAAIEPAKARDEPLESVTLQLQPVADEAGCDAASCDVCGSTFFWVDAECAVRCRFCEPPEADQIQDLLVLTVDILGEPQWQKDYESWSEYLTEAPDEDSVLYCGWWISRADLEFLTTPREPVYPCAYCGGLFTHSPSCYELLADRSWGIVMPFGKHQGERMCDVPKNYLRWLLSNATLKDGLHDEAIRVLHGRRD